MSKSMPTNGTISLNLGFEEKRAITFNNDADRTVYVDISDTNILSRLQESIPEIESNQAVLYGVLDDVENADTASRTSSLLNAFKDADAFIREKIDYIFDAPVSAVAAPSGNMYDVFNGSYRFEYIIMALMNVYSDNVSAEYEKMAKKISKHTKKYAKGK